MQTGWAERKSPSPWTIPMRASRPARLTAASPAVCAGARRRVRPAAGAVLRRAACPARNARPLTGRPSSVRFPSAGPPAPPAPLWTAGRPWPTWVWSRRNWALAPRLADTPSSACRSGVCRRRPRCFHLENRPDRPVSTCRSFHRSRTGCLFHGFQHLVGLSLTDRRILPKKWKLSLFPYVISTLYSLFLPET